MFVLVGRSQDAQTTLFENVLCDVEAADGKGRIVCVEKHVEMFHAEFS